MVDDHQSSFAALAGRAYAEAGLRFDARDPTCLEVLRHALHFMRFQRRARMLREIAKHPVHLVVSGDRLTLDAHPKASVQVGTTLPETLTLMEHAGVMAMALSFNDGLSERFLSAMHRGCVPLIVPNRLLAENFQDGVHHLAIKPDMSDIHQVLDRARDPRLLDSMAQAGKAAVTDTYSPERIVGRFLASIGPLMPVGREP